MSGQFCTDFMSGDYDVGDGLCTCPVCKGFLSRHFPVSEGKQWQCKSCGVVLEVILNPPQDYEIEAHIDWYTHHMGILYSLGLLSIPECPPSDEFVEGRICVVPDYAVTMPVVDYKEMRKNRPPKKHLTGIKVYGTTKGHPMWIRSVWKDKDGSFINMDGKRVVYDSEEWHQMIQGNMPSKEPAQ